MARPLILATAVAVAALTASSALAAPPVHLVDPTGDAGPLTTASPAHARTGSVPGFDITRVAIARAPGGTSTQFTMTLAATPVPAGYYLVNFDAPGCSGAKNWPSAPVQPPAAGQASFGAGVRVVLAYPAGPAAPMAFVDCVAPGATAARQPAAAVVKGSSIVWTVPMNSYLRKNVTLTKVHAYTATAGTGFQDTFMDIAGPGKPYRVR